MDNNLMIIQNYNKNKIIKSSIEIREQQQQSNNNRIQTSPQIDWAITSSFSPWRQNCKDNQKNKIELFKIPASVRKVLKIQKIMKNNNRNYKHQDVEQKQSSNLMNSIIKQQVSNEYYNPENSDTNKFNKFTIINRDIYTPPHNLTRRKKQISEDYKKSKQSKKSKDSIENSGLRELKQKILSPLRKGTMFTKGIDSYRSEFQGSSILNINSIKPIEKKQLAFNLFKKSEGQQRVNYSNISKIYENERRLIEMKIKQVQKKYKQTFESRLKNNGQENVIELKNNYSNLNKNLEISNDNIRIKKKKQLFKQNYTFIVPFQRYYYRDFIWKLAYSHHLLNQIPPQYPKQFKVYIGPGNNKMLIKSLLKRRGWWSFSQKLQDCHFVWTQIKISDLFKNQSKCTQNYDLIKPKQQVINIKNTDSKQEEKMIKSDILNKKILSRQDLEQWKTYIKNNKKMEQKTKQNLQYRNKILKKSFYIKINPFDLKMHNHLQNNYVIGNKKALFYTMCNFYQKFNKNVFQHLPLTFHIESGIEDPVYLKFLNAYYQKSKMLKKKQKQQEKKAKLQKNIWIVKPGQFTNRGTGITVCLTLQEIKTLIKTKQKHPNGKVKTYIVQQYIDRPFLYHKRKFDLRHYMMITSINGIIRGYWYQQGYIRTTSFQYSLKTNTTGIHLTNDAVQKYLPDYGKYQKGNKISYQQLQKYLDKEYPNKYNFFQTVYPKMKTLAIDAIKASFLSIDPQKRLHNFEIFGMDFMIDENFSPWLIEINTNPCLELSCPLLAKIIPNMVQNALRISLDPIFPPPSNLIEKKSYFSQNVLQNNKFELVFDSISDGNEIQKIYNSTDNKYEIRDVSENDELFEDQGKQWDQI